jgi:hypothetical protein
MNHETWMNKRQGNARIRSPQKGRTIADALRSEYHAPGLGDEIDSTAENELTARYMRESQERDLINSQQEENRCSMN